MVEYWVLGPLEVRDGDESLRLGGAKQRALLALLLLNANRVVARDRLIDELWPEEPPATAVTTVQVYVSRLRKALPAGALVTRPPGYLLTVEPEAVDLNRFERLVAAARAVDPAHAACLLREALGLWRGPPLAEFAEVPSVRSQGGRLEELRLVTLEERIAAELELGLHAELVGELEMLTVEAPERMRLRGQLMLALYRCGRHDEALAALREARVTLDGVGLEPNEALRRLERQILTQDPALDLVQSRLLVDEPIPLPGPLVPESPFPFVGRKDELRKLRALLERAEGGQGGVVLLASEAGGGKTRLIRELAHEAAARGVLVLYGAADAAVSVPYQPLREWFEFLFPVCDPDALRACLGVGGDQASRLIPELAALTGEPAPLSGDPESSRYLVQGAVAELLRRISHVQPLLLVADDVHWSDSEMPQLLRRLARTAPEARMLVVAAFRDRGEEIGAELSDTLTDLSRLDGVTRLALGNLSAEDVRALIRGSTDAEASEELASAIGALTSGTPLFVCELWRDLFDSSVVEVWNDRVRLTRPVAELRGPGRIRELVQQRLSRLAPATTAMLEFAAVIGPRFELRVLAEAARLDQGGMLAAVDEASRKGIIEELPEPAPACRFTHELVRRAVYDLIPRVRRPELHLRVGDAIEQMHASDLARDLPELAFHFTLAAPRAGPERAVAYNLRAAEAAIASLAYSEAAARLSSALELGIGDLRERARVQSELGVLLFETGRIVESEAILAASLEAATSIGERGLKTRVLVQLAWDRMNSDPGVDFREIQTVAENAIETFTELGDSLGLAIAERLVGFALRCEGRVGESLGALERALVNADASREPAMRRRVIGTLGRALCEGPAPVDEAIRRCEELLQLSGGDRGFEALISRFLSALSAMAARFDESREHLRRGGSLLDVLNDSGLDVAEAMELAGDRAGAADELAETWRHFRETGGGALDTRALGRAARLALLYCDEGRWDDAADCLAYGRDLPEPIKFRPSAVLRLAAQARIASHSGESAEAVRLAQRAVELAEGSDFLNHRARVWRALAEVQRRNGQTAEAAAAAAAALRLYQTKGNVAAAARLQAAQAAAS